MALTLTDMVSMIQFRLGRRTDLAADIEREIRLAQTRLEDSPRLEPWFLVEEVELTLSAGSTSVALPADFVRESEEKQLQYVNEGLEYPIERGSADEAVESYQGDAGVPKIYVLGDGVLRVYPAADKDYTLRYTVVLRQPELDSGAADPVLSNAWVVDAYPLLMNKALITLAQSLGNDRVLKNASEDMSAAVAELQTRIVQREDSNQTYQRAKGRGDHLGR